MTKKQIVLEIVAWILTLFLVLVFFRAGVTKFSDSGFWAAAFRHWGFPVWFRILIGVVEAGGALLLLWPRTASYAAINLGVVMVGAIGTVLVAGQTRNLVQPTVALLLCSVVAALRWRKRLHMPARSAAIFSATS